MLLRHRIAPLAAAIALTACAASALAQTPLDPSFKFQGELRFNNVVANSPHDFIFDVFGAAAGGVSLGSNNRPNIPVARGVFTVTLSFGASVFQGDKRWLEIRVRDTLSGGAFTTLTPRVELNAAPNALFALSIADASVTSAKILDGTVGTVDLANSAVTSGKIADGTVTSADLANGSVGSAKIATDAVSSVKILDGSITAADIGPNLVSAVDGVSNDGGNIDLVAGSGVVITPNDAANTITIAATGDATLLDGIDGAQFLRSDVPDVFTGGTLSFTGGSTLLVTGGSSGAFTIGGLNLILNLGDSGADTAIVPGVLEVDGTLKVDGIVDIDSPELLLGSTATTTLRFFETGTLSFANRIAWEDGIVTAFGELGACVPTGPTKSAFVFDVTDNFESGWVFTNGADAEVIIDELGAVTADSSFHASAGCDLAEAFLGPDGLVAGTLVSADPNVPEAVIASGRAYDPTMVGVVSASPAFRMAGGTADVLPVIADLRETQSLLRDRPNDPALLGRFSDLERAVDSWPRGNVDVALVGRVPVLVVGRVRAGEPLTSSGLPGRAMALDRPGPSIGIALEESDGSRDSVVVLLQPGHRLPLDEEGPPTVERGDEIAVGAAATAGVADLDRRLLRLEEMVDGTGETSAGSLAGTSTVGGLRGPSGADGADGPDGPAHPGARPSRESWGDYDGDGLDDVLVVNPAAPARLLRNRGDGAFADVTRGAGLDHAQGLRFGLWSDVDGDANLDLLIVDANGAATLLQGAGNGSFTDVTAAFGLDFGRPIIDAGWIDYDRDRRPDLRVELADGTLLLFHNRGSGAFERVELRGPTPTPAAGARDSGLEAELRSLKAMVEALLAERAEVRR